MPQFSLAGASGFDLPPPIRHGPAMARRVFYPVMSSNSFDEPPRDSDSANGGSSGRGDESSSWISEPNSSSVEDLASQQADEIYEAEFVDHLPRSRLLLRRRRLLPLGLFLLTCLSTFFVGACRWAPSAYLFPQDDPEWMNLRIVLIAHWDDGLIYMACVLAILLTHEMGHFVATLWHRIPASYPYCLPLPITPFGTLGAVIGMDGLRANRRQMFDIGIAGPLAGLLVAIPILLVGVNQLDFLEPRYGIFKLDNPLFVELLLNIQQPRGYVAGSPVWAGQLNPYFMAGWVGFFITGLNMMPVSQLDGGHVIYTLFGRKAHWIARGFMLLAVLWVMSYGNKGFLLMIFLVMLVGTDHPPTSNDSVPLGWFRTSLGYASLAIPVFCFAPQAIF